MKPKNRGYIGKVNQIKKAHSSEKLKFQVFSTESTASPQIYCGFFPRVWHTYDTSTTIVSPPFCSPSRQAGCYVIPGCTCVPHLYLLLAGLQAGFSVRSLMWLRPVYLLQACVPAIKVTESLTALLLVNLHVREEAGAHYLPLSTRTPRQV